MSEKTPNPGSPEAVALGCRCPVLDNVHGKGSYRLNGVPQFWVSEQCILHGNPVQDAHELRREER